jgi:feruloyl esterase
VRCLRLATAFLACLTAFGACEDIVKLQLPVTSVTVAEMITGGSFTPPGGTRTITGLPPFCRIAGIIRPSSDSNIRFEVWLPAKDWNRKFQGIGNGGFAGAIAYDPVGLAGPLKRGYATASTDTGHSGSGLDASWAPGHPEKIIDYGHRAVHLMTERAKSIIAAYYGEPPVRSYFSSCSNGGRQALMEAQRYPADYDGIIAGAPAYDFTNLLASFVWTSQTLAKTALPATTLPAIEAAALSACDERDGVKDGILDPAACNFDPSAAQCAGTASEGCLTADQVSSLRRIYRGPQNTKGEILYPGFPPGAETGPGGWSLWITGQGSTPGHQTTFGTQYLRHMLFQDPKYDYLAFSFDRDLPVANDKLGPILNATNPDLKQFQARGGKLILFHGWADAAIPAQSTIDYYNRVRKTMGPATADAFVRLYMVPGMQHCAGGPGTASFGGYGEGGGEMLAALERWVENGAAPDRIIATKLGSTPRTRPLCPYPQVARYKGTGSTDDAANFECAATPTALK